MNPRALYPVIVFVGLLVLAIIVGNWFLQIATGRPLDKIPGFLQFIVHGISFTIIAIIAKKYFGG